MGNCDASTYDWSADVLRVASSEHRRQEVDALKDELVEAAIRLDDHGRLGVDRVRELARQIKALREAK